jgi:NAD(P)-dependent dehydrogenase (short-subunit alcohol dehydrogenase family)
MKSVLTTGANSGIGLAAAVAIARAGFRSVGSVRSAEKAAVVARAAEEAGVSVETVLLDVTDAAACERVIDDLRPWGLVNNAGSSLTGAVEDVQDDEARRLLETMVIAPARIARLALPGMRAAGGGRIVNVSSIYGRTTTPLSGWYQAAKHALEALSDALRMEVASAGVSVVLVEPGGFRTGIWEEHARDIARRRDSQYQTAYRRSLESLRWTQALMGDPSAVATVIVRALSARWPSARYLVGYDAQLVTLTDMVLPTALKDRLSRLMLGL